VKIIDKILNLLMRKPKKAEQLKQEYKITDIFIPGGVPKYTYYLRDELGLNARLIEALSGKKLLIVTGQTKSGKSVLVKKTINGPRIWVDGGSIKNEEEFWDFLSVKLNTYNTSTVSLDVESTENESLSASFGLPNIGIQTFEEFQRRLSVSLSTTRGVSNKIAVINIINDIKIPLIIDDFHYIPRETQLSIVRALKAPIAAGLPVVIIAIPHRKFDPIRVEREMTGRVTALAIPPWVHKELQYIADKGFPLLNLDVPDKIVSNFTNESLGSPNLMQEFCLQYANGAINGKTTIDDIFYYEIAKNTSRTIFEKLLTGPRQRKDRKTYTLINGEQTDIYGVILYSLSKLGIGIQTYRYEEIRTKIRECIGENIPTLTQVSSTLKHMSTIALSDESSTPVLEWEPSDNVLHITDPYFAFFLKWGLKYGLKSESIEKG
jgi:hypothetical protein